MRCRDISEIDRILKEMIWLHSFIFIRYMSSPVAMARLDPSVDAGVRCPEKKSAFLNSVYTPFYYLSICMLR